MNARRLLPILNDVLLATAIAVQVAPAQWSRDPAVNTPISLASGDQSSPQIVSDGAGGGIIVWVDCRPGLRSSCGIFAQRINAQGQLQWQTSDGNWNGVPICDVSGGGSSDPVIISDGAGGAIIAWVDRRNNFTTGLDIYAQRIDGNRNLMWEGSGVSVCSVCSEGGDQLDRVVTSDGDGGAFIAWTDKSDRTNTQVFIQHLNSQGRPTWNPPGGVMVSSSAGYQIAITRDNNGGVFIAYAMTALNHIGYHYLVKRIDERGNRYWAEPCADQYDHPDGGICLPGHNGRGVRLVPSDADVIVVWNAESQYPACFPRVTTEGTPSVMRTQKFDRSGNRLWPSDVCIRTSDTRNHQNFVVTSDGHNGFIAFYYAEPTMHSHDGPWFAQRITSSGEAPWGPSGAVFPEAARLSSAAPDESGGGAIAWGYEDVFAQRMGALGDRPWGENGIPVSTATGNQHNPRMINDGIGGFIVVWEDERNGNKDIYAQRINLDGTLGGIPQLTLPEQPQPIPRWWWPRGCDFRAGFDFAHGNGFNWSLDLEFRLVDQLSLVGLFNRHQLNGASKGVDLKFNQFALQLKYYVVPAGVTPFVNAGGGIYKFDSGPSKAGISGGGGIVFALSSSLALETSYTFHSLFKTTPDVMFSSLQAGLKVGF